MKGKSRPTPPARRQNNAATFPYASEPWFLAEITGVVGDGYTFKEMWLDGETEAVAEMFGGRINTSDDLAMAVSGGPFAVGDIVLVRSGRGAAGLLWEVIPLDGCCGWGADYATALRVTGSSGSVPANVQIPFSGSTATGVVVETLLKIPANSGPVLVSGGLLLGWGFNAAEPVAANRSIVAEAGLTVADSYGNGSTTPALWAVRRPGLYGGWDANSSAVNAPLGRYGDQTLVGSGVAIAWPGNGYARLGRHVYAEYVLAGSASDRYLAWAVSGARAGTWTGFDYPLVVWAFGLGGTWLRYEKICCPDDPIEPPRLMSPPRGMSMELQSVPSVAQQWRAAQGGAAGAGGPSGSPSTGIGGA